MTQMELNKILENHKHWLNEDCDGWERMRANLEDANLEDANLEDATLAGANLAGANLENANLKDANFDGADLTNVNLHGANLAGVDFEGANLDGADLTGANLRGADLADANLTGALITDANLVSVNLQGAKNVPFIPLACPDSGTFTAYKRAGRYIVKLQIPEDAKRLSATGRKCRCDRAVVLEIQEIDGTKAGITKVKSNFDETFIYEVGKTVSVDNFNNNRWNECSTGIHFFVNRQEAVQY